MGRITTLYVVLACTLVSAAANAQSFILFDLTAASHYTQTAASSINSSGQITGYGVTSKGEIHAFLFANGSFKDLGMFGYSGAAGMAINNTG